MSVPTSVPRRRRKAHDQRDTGAIHNATQHIAPERVGAEKEVRIGWLQANGQAALIEIKLVRIVGSNDRRQQSHHDKPTEDEGTGGTKRFAADQDGQPQPALLQEPPG
jgi:hypothetical protein